MGSALIQRATKLARRVIPRTLWVHPFLSLLVAGVLLGGGLRFLPTSSAAASSAGSGSTACAAK
jgi:hypothetical protein